MSNPNFDIEAISHLAALKYGWDENTRTDTVACYEEYLEKAATGAGGRPTVSVDQLWHLHIVNTTSYVPYCESRFGKYVHHIACVEPEIVPKLIERLGGILPRFMPTTLGAVDPTSANCGGDRFMPTTLGAVDPTSANCGGDEPVPGVQSSANSEGVGEHSSEMSSSGLRANCGSDGPMGP